MAVYNCWLPNRNRWTNNLCPIGRGYQNSDKPFPLTYEEARTLANHWTKGVPHSSILFGAQVREFDPQTYQPIGGPVLFVREQASSQSEAKSDGCFCKGCGEFFPMAVPNQADGTLKCYSCRR